MQQQSRLRRPVTRSNSCPQELWVKGLMMFAGRKRSCFQNAHSRSPQVRITSCKQNTTSQRHRSLKDSTKSTDLREQENNTIACTDCLTVSAILQPSLRNPIYPGRGLGESHILDSFPPLLSHQIKCVLRAIYLRANIVNL